MQPYQLLLGVDIGATTATVSWRAAEGQPTRALIIDQAPQAFTTLQQCLFATGYAPAVILVVLEATGTSWISLATSLAQAGFAVSVINPSQAHAFA